MNSTVIVHSSRGKAYGRILPTDESPLDSATRAVRRLYGRSACVWKWVSTGRNEDRSGRITAEHYQATVYINEEQTP